MSDFCTVHKLPFGNPVRGYQYFLYVTGKGYATEDAVTFVDAVSNGAVSFSEPESLCRFVKGCGWTIAEDLPEEVKQAWKSG